MEKKISYVIVAIVAVFLLFRWCGNASTSSLESLYGTYQGTDNNGRKVKIILKSESDNEWRKYGEDWSDNLVYKDSYGKIKDMDWQTIKWTWDLEEGYVKTYYIGRGSTGDPRIIIDVKGGKMYNSWGEYLDKQNGFKFTKH